MGKRPLKKKKRSNLKQLGTKRQLAHFENINRSMQTLRSLRTRTKSNSVCVYFSHGAMLSVEQVPKLCLRDCARETSLGQKCELTLYSLFTMASLGVGLAEWGNGQKEPRVS